MAGNTSDKTVNDQRLRGLGDGEILTESILGRGNGSILFKKVGAVVTAYYRWTIDKKPGQLKIGAYALTKRSPGLNLQEIRDRAGDHVKVLKAYGNPKVYYASQARLAEYQREAEKEAAEADARRGTFKDLLDYYVADLRDRGKVKASNVASDFRNHILEPFPDLACKPAKDITEHDIARIMTNILASKPRRRGKNNTTPAPVTSMKSTADTVHTYLCAAFKKAQSTVIDLESSITDRKDFEVKTNPAKGVKALVNVYMGTTESLEQKELSELLKYLHTLPERQRAMALAPIYLGGQRLKMLAPTLWSDIDEDGIMMLDIKGNAPPRPHYVPLTPRIRTIMSPLFDLRLSPKGPFAVTENLAGQGYLIKVYAKAGTALSKEKKTRYFSWKNIRVSAETLMAGLGVKAEIRAHILSHGREQNGIQSKHYDRNTYYREKTEALTIWSDYLDGLLEGKIRSDIKIYTLADLRKVDSRAN
ncbi:hypothetical protein [Pseudomonas sp. JS425]|uniref:tyrosine-type recombinase/integrase n=1 Tax=Pseudomonas sp. JS425 TaxID=2829498 RepID=UPI001BAF67A0|nr:hypothetical protein [Pseudomonas sp. JS425]QUN66321.1 hypothetical protein KDB76_20925 [Pseudomonas sp. JS425]